ncbi:MAG: hypothetical protein SGCHY_003936 [Lobulomycetales sp.]
MKDINPRTIHLEFFGSLGCLATLLMMPAVSLALNLNLNQSLSKDLLVLDSDLAIAAAAYAAWLAFQLVCWWLIPGAWIKGSLLRDGETRLLYKMNAFRVLIATHVALAGLVYTFGLSPLVWVANHTLQFTIVTLAFSLVLSTALYIASFRSPTPLLSTVGNSGYPIHDFFIGRELNPRLFSGSLDLKQFCELRPGIFLWVLVNYAYAAKQLVETGSVSASMAFICLGQLLYAADSVWFESAILTTMDITTDGFGYMLVVGDLVWVPFTYTMQARHLSLSRAPVSPGSTAMMTALLALFIASYITFRGSNSQKNDFRTLDPGHPRVAHLEYIKTEATPGSRLLVSGWWGMARHINYLGDWGMAVSWCAASALESGDAVSVVPWFYALYFGVLLVHRYVCRPAYPLYVVMDVDVGRAYRDDVKCRNKYGADWEKYCRIVPYQLVPGVY